PLKPPPTQFSTITDIPLVHKTTELYKKIYQISSGLPKKERLGIFLRLETTILEMLESAIEAAFLSRTEKLPMIMHLRRQTEIAKRLTRITHDLNLLDQTKYIRLSADLQEISKMANGWIKSLI
ncbi:MAG: four helix bundle protein, partial [Patescibacteria group bacterium]